MIPVLFLIVWLMSGVVATTLAIYAIAEDERMRVVYDSYVIWTITKGALTGPFAILPAFYIIREIEAQYD